MEGRTRSDEEHHAEDFVSARLWPPVPPMTIDDDIEVISAITAWRKANDTRKSYLSARRLLLKLKRERRDGSRSEKTT